MKNTITYDWRDGSIEHREIADFENGTPFWLYHGLGIEFRGPEREYDSEKLVEAFRAEFGDDLDALREGFAEVWDGHNHVGQWPEQSDEEREAHEIGMLALRDAVQQWEPGTGSEIWDASDYYHGALTFAQIVDAIGMTRNTTDDEIVEIVETEEQKAAVAGCTLRGLSKFVEGIRDRLREEGEEVE
jgi:hypothetical protein